MPHLLRLAALLAVCSLQSACFFACNDAFYPSVSVQVVDAEGRPVQDARVTFTQNGGPEQLAPKNPCSPDVERCDTWWAGLDEPGVFVVKATSADGTRSAEQRVTVGGDMCHADTESIQLTL